MRKGRRTREEARKINEIGQSFKEEGLRTSTKDDQIHSFNIQDNSVKTDDGVDCTEDNELFKSNTVVGHDTSLALPTNIEVPCAQEPDAMEDRVPTQVPTLNLSSNAINCGGDLHPLINDNENSSTDIIDASPRSKRNRSRNWSDGDQSISKDETLSEAPQYEKCVDSMETDAAQPIIDNESLSTTSQNDSCAGQSQPFISGSISTDESPKDVNDKGSSTSNDGSTEILNSHSDISKNLPRPVLQDTNVSHDITQSTCDVQDSFFSINAASNSISGIEPLDNETQSFNNDSIQSGYSGSEFELGRVTSTSPLERSRTGDILLHVEKENVSSPDAESTPLVPENGNNFLSVPTERHQRDAQEQDVAAKNNFSVPSPNTIAQELSPVSRERILSLMEHSTTDDSSGDDSVFSNNCLDSNIEVTVSEP